MMLGIEPMSECLSESIKYTCASSFLVNPFDPKPGQLKLAVKGNRLLFVNTWNGTIANK